jgi:uncharacterized protein
VKHTSPLKVSTIALTVFCLIQFESPAQTNRADAPDFLAVKDKLILLPPGTVRAGGRVEQEMLEDNDGWVRTVNEMGEEGRWMQGISGGADVYAQGDKEKFDYPLVNRRGKFGSPAGAGEYHIHWLDIVTRLGWAGNIPEDRRLGTDCVNEILSHLNSDGYVGIFPAEQEFRGGQAQVYDCIFETFTYGEMISALWYYYQCTSDERVLKACLKAANLFCSQVGPASKSKRTVLPAPQACPTTICDALVKLYQFTGDKEYLETAESSLRDLLAAEAREKSLREDKVLSGHSAGWGIVACSMAEVYRANASQDLLDDLNNYQKKLQPNMQPTGAPSGHWEGLAGTGPYVNTETCDTFWQFLWCARMLEITGKIEYADMAEKACLNALPGARSKDGRVIAYFFAPNQLIAARRANKTEYPARLYIECCQANAPRLMPMLAEHLVMATPDGGFAVPFFAPSVSKLTANDGSAVTITEETQYPFDETVTIRLKTERPKERFPLLLRIPGWCNGAKIRINSKKLSGKYQPGSWARLEREWNDDDTVELSLPMEVKTGFWKDRAAYVERGPLLYCLPISGQKQIQDKWGSFEETARADSSWNYALVFDQANPKPSFKVKRLATTPGTHAWESSPIALEVDAVKIPNWKFSPGNEPFKPVDDSVPPPPDGFKQLYGMIDQPTSPAIPAYPLAMAGPMQKVRLIPFGFTTLRMTYLPFVSPAEYRTRLGK